MGPFCMYPSQGEMVSVTKRTEFLRIRLSPEEKLSILTATRRSRAPDPSKWARQLLLQAARSPTRSIESPEG